MFWILGHKACGIWALRPGIELTLPALEGKVLTTGQPGEVPKQIEFKFWAVKCMIPFQSSGLWPSNVIIWASIFVKCTTDFIYLCLC